MYLYNKYIIFHNYVSKLKCTNYCKIHLRGQINSSNFQDSHCPDLRPDFTLQYEDSELANSEV